jgi:hypothetical protein
MSVYEWRVFSQRTISNDVIFKHITKRIHFWCFSLMVDDFIWGGRAVQILQLRLLAEQFESKCYHIGIKHADDIILSLLSASSSIFPQNVFLVSTWWTKASVARRQSPNILCATPWILERDKLGCLLSVWVDWREIRTDICLNVSAYFLDVFGRPGVGGGFLLKALSVSFKFCST